ncbi:MAG: TIGR00270 family protein [Archaeoglobus sp.]|nr:MAG: TIGR00270 family protein [Archaeoglobus sp.]
MECEICGREIKGRSYRILVEGSEMTVCAKCKDFGAEKPFVEIKKLTLKKKSKPKVEPIEFVEELVENFNEIVRREREKRGWSQSELALKIQEKESLIRKIENCEITPEPEVVKKLEKLFGVKLMEKVPEIKVDMKKSNITPTLGDVVVIKKKKK